MTAKRYHSGDAYRADIEQRAREIWDTRERKFPAHTQQTWEQGTDLARTIALNMARLEIDNG